MYIPPEEVARRANNLGYQIYFADELSTREIENKFTVFLPLLFSKPNSGHMFTKEGELRKIILGETEVDLHSHCLLTGEVRNPRLLASVIQSLTSWSRRSCVTITRNLNEACKDLYPTIGSFCCVNRRCIPDSAENLPSNLRTDLPVLFLWGTADPTCTQPLIQKSYKFIPRLWDIALEGRGHWLMIEAKDDVTRTVLKWLDEMVIPKVKL